VDGQHLGGIFVVVDDEYLERRARCNTARARAVFLRRARQRQRHLHRRAVAMAFA